MSEKKNLAQLLGTKYPFMQGAMANISNGEFAAAMSNAGALGIIASGGMDVETLEANIAKCRELTSKPFGVNVMMKHPQVADVCDLVAQSGVDVVTTGAGNPGPYIDRWKEAGIKVIPVVPSVALAVRVERAGADAVVAEGTESGGHVGEMATMAMVPQIVDAVQIPVVAAGGIASGRQFVAALALGAVGAQLGTCLLVSEECPIHPNYKQAILDAKDCDTAVTGRFAGSPVRQLKNHMARAYLKDEKQGMSREDLGHYMIGALRKAVIDGDTRDGSLISGQVAGMLHEIRPAAQIFEEIYRDALGARSELDAMMASIYGAGEAGFGAADAEGEVLA